MDDTKTTAPTRNTLVPVSQDRHQGQFWQRFTTYDFVNHRRVVPIVLGEHEQVAASLPFFFIQTAAGPWPVALTRLSTKGKCAFVAPNGAWLGSYIPSILRVHPFSAQSVDTAQLALLIDEGSELVSEDPRHEPFFTPEGALAPALEQVVEFFRKRAAAETRTRDAMKAVAACSLLRPFEPAEGLNMAAEGLMVVDRARLDNLGRIDLATLHRNGALALLITQCVSLNHLSFMAHVEARAQTATARPQTSEHVAPDTAARQKQEALSGFFDALAEAHDNDMPEVLNPFHDGDAQQDAPRKDEKNATVADKSTPRD
ncbi:MAG: SapC family protein [Pararhodobacter sp.]|nr:SapC family protein [Pararhodobacter sp.]